MFSLLAVFGASLFLCLCLTPVARRLARRVGLIDHPDRHRKIHIAPTPVSGGLAVLAAVVAALAIALLLGGSAAVALWERGNVLLGLLGGSVLVCALGVVDDFGQLRGRHKLLGQILAVSFVIALGGWVDTVQLFGVPFELGWLGIPFTIFVMVGAINSLNLIDGMDGLLGSVGVILSLALAAMALLAGHVWAAAVALALAGALVGFLSFNLPPASIFMGDSGSMLVGLILGTLAIQCSLKAPTTLAVAMPVALLILPIFDTTAAILRRKLTGRSIYTTDRGHLHHCLLRSGLSTPWALVVVGVCCLITCGGVLASQAFNHEWIAVVTAGAIIATLITTRLFGHVEFMLVKGRLTSLWAPARQAHQLEVRLQGTAAWKELWQALLVRVDELNLCQLLLDVNAPALHEGYHARWDNQSAEGDQSSHWHVEIPIRVREYSVGRLMLAGTWDRQPIWLKIARVMEVIDNFNKPAGQEAAETPAWVTAAEHLAAAAQPAAVEVMQS